MKKQDAIDALFAAAIGLKLTSVTVRQEEFDEMKRRDLIDFVPNGSGGEHGYLAGARIDVAP